LLEVSGEVGGVLKRIFKRPKEELFLSFFGS